jgi:hypothetical protein
MSTSSNDQEKNQSEARSRGLHTIETPADDPQTPHAVDMEVGLAERVTPEDT